MFLNFDGARPRPRRLQKTSPEIKMRVFDFKIFFLVSECTMQFRPWPVDKDSKRERPLRQILEPRSAYILRGPSRTRWQHHIAETRNRRLSLTFRTLRKSI
jgi:hypothetical protein